MILLTKEAVVFLFLEAVLLGLLVVAFCAAVPMLRRWDFGATSSAQYRLEKSAYLVVLIIQFTLAAKILLLPLFCHLIDALAAVVPGAMCGAGVLYADVYGPVLLPWKLAVLALAGIWLIVNRRDTQAMDHPFFTVKLRLFVVLVVLVVVESVLDVLFLVNIETLTPVQCCSVIYGVAGEADPLPLGLDKRTLLLLFGLGYALVLVTGLVRYTRLGLLANAAFLFFGYHAVVFFFGTYVYELPTHRCPFCMLQGDYWYFGYVLWGFLLAGVFCGIAAYPVEKITGAKTTALRAGNIGLVSAFVLLCVLRVVLYYLRNGVFL